MKNLNIKSLMVITIVFSSVLAMPMVAVGQEKDYNDIFNFDQANVGIFEGFKGGFGAIFSNYLGYGGKILASLFETLFLHDLNLTSYEMLDNVFVLSANRTHRIPMGTYNFTAENDERDIYFAPHEYMSDLASFTEMELNQTGYAYCVVEKQGVFTYTLEVGAAITLIIWDNDRSFITALNKLLDFFKRVMYYQLLHKPLPATLIQDGISKLTWFLIHINDIFTGDELFILNPITWQKLDINPGLGFNITKTWYTTGDTPGDMNINPTDPRIIDLPHGNDVLLNWTATAQSRKDNYMEWLLTPTLGNVAETIWTQFSFDLIQLWVKNFEIHIDIAAIINAVKSEGGASAENLIANAFKGCNIEFYLFTHHLAGAFLYNDTVPDNVISANYTPITVDGTTVEVPYSTELTHRLILGTVGGFNFEIPHIDESNKSVSWGINILDANISAVPLGVDLHSYLGAPQENLDYIHFGFTFEPLVNRTLGAAHGLVKLNQEFAPWNAPESYGANSPIAGLDLAIIYVSTVLHFELDIATRQEAIDNPPENPPELLKQENYKSTQHKLMIGDYIGRSAQGELEFIDIAGPEYEYGSESSRLNASASTSIIPLFVWLMEHEKHDTYIIAGGEEVDTFASDIRIQTELSAMVYAVCYPEFEDGTGIWHDPTFSVYMVFGAEAFWALIVLIAGVGLVGVATILIKRRKDRRF